MKKAISFLALALLVLSLGAVTRAHGQAASQPASSTLPPQLAILDTDIGDDIDDAFALALVLRSPELKLLGITTTYGDTDLRARLADRFVTAVGSNIAINAGVMTKHDNVMTQAEYAKGGPKIVYDDAVDFLMSEIRGHPGAITLIAIGPLTNVEAAIKRDPATFRKLRRVVMMGGSIQRGYDNAKREHQPPDAEWNIKADPAGAALLLASGVPVYMMPLDSTQIRLEPADREKILSHGSPLTNQLKDLYQEWVAANDGHWTTPTLFDPVAVAYAVKPELCPATPMSLRVDDKGYTRVVNNGPTNAWVCMQSDEKAFLSLLLNRILNDAAH